MKRKEQIAALKEYQKKRRAFYHMSNLLAYDASVAMPPGAVELMGETMGVISGQLHSLQTASSTKSLLNDLYEAREELDLQTRREVEELHLEQEKMEKISEKELVAMEEAENLATHAWEQAKTANDFSIFAPHLEQVIAMKKRYAACVAPGKDVYEVLLDEHERGMTKAQLEPFFDALREELVPLFKKIGQKEQPDLSFLKGLFSIEKQRELSEKAMDLMGIDKTRCTLGETEHPFTIRFSKNDVRITTKYLAEDVMSNLYSIVHEGGHGLYELSIDDALIRSVLGGGASTAMHEASARLWENCIGRSLPFCEALLHLLREVFPESFEAVDEADFYRAMNAANAGCIRMDADELTYPLHIMVRYEIEKRIFADEISVSEIPVEWNRLYMEYLGVEVPDDAHGVLQDMHWASGAFGYFPSYAIGTAYAAQIYRALQREVDIKACCQAGDLSKVRQWLTEKIYRYGMLYSAQELLETACGTPFEPCCYASYLKEKYETLYGI
ncbi:carboxypeptidase M32 [Emergencia sp. JLR.KK010]|uniref:carboxypeptidase M32 n=1 Tax=Emergencia sp. JLR.KK010 TaxID=3114296 RepID=UPI00203AC2D3